MHRFFAFLLIFVVVGCQSSAPKVRQVEEVKYTAKDILQYQIKEPLSTKKAPLLVLLHGYGDNALNFSNIGDHFDKRLAKVSIYAPQDYNNNRFGWYNIDFTTPDKKGNLGEAEIARQQILATLDDVIQKYNVDTEQVYFLGFSQGTIMSLNVALSAPEKVKGLLLYSGKLLRDLDSRIVEKERLKSLQVFLTHGIKDPTLYIEEGRLINEKLKGLGIKDLTYSEFDAGHTIPQAQLQAGMNWLSQRLDQ